MLLKLEAFDLAEKGYDTPYFRRQMAILKKLAARGGVPNDKILDAFTKEEIVYTINGNSEWDAYWKMGGEHWLEAAWNTAGSFSVTTSDERSEECDFELHTVWDPETKSVHMTGEFCGVEVDKTWSRDRDRHHDKDGESGHHGDRNGA